VSLKVKLTALIALLVLVVVLAASALYVYIFVQETLHEVEKRGDYLLEATGRLVMAVEKTARLPAGAQFLNVIESIFSGMAKAIIHNSDYSSPEAAKDAIDRYFKERNDHFVRCPKRAGRKIWGQERVPSEFSEANNCKDPLYR